VFVTIFAFWQKSRQTNSPFDFLPTVKTAVYKPDRRSLKPLMVEVYVVVLPWFDLLIRELRKLFNYSENQI